MCCPVENLSTHLKADEEDTSLHAKAVRPISPRSQIELTIYNINNINGNTHMLNLQYTGAEILLPASVLGSRFHGRRKILPYRELFYKQIVSTYYVLLTVLDCLKCSILIYNLKSSNLRDRLKVVEDWIRGEEMRRTLRRIISYEMELGIDMKLF